MQSRVLNLGLPHVWVFFSLVCFLYQYHNKKFIKKICAATYCAIQLRINLCLYKLRWIHVVGGVMSQHNHCLTLNTEDTVQS